MDPPNSPKLPKDPFAYSKPPKIRVKKVKVRVSKTNPRGWEIVENSAQNPSVEPPTEQPNASTGERPAKTPTKEAPKSQTPPRDPPAPATNRKRKGPEITTKKVKVRKTNSGGRENVDAPPQTPRVETPTPREEDAVSISDSLDSLFNDPKEGAEQGPQPIEQEIKKEGSPKLGDIPEKEPTPEEEPIPQQGAAPEPEAAPKPTRKEGVKHQNPLINTLRREVDKKEKDKRKASSSEGNKAKDKKKASTEHGDSFLIEDCQMTFKFRDRTQQALNKKNPLTARRFKLMDVSMVLNEYLSANPGARVIPVRKDSSSYSTLKVFLRACGADSDDGQILGVPDLLDEDRMPFLMLCQLHLCGQMLEAPKICDAVTDRIWILFKNQQIYGLRNAKSLDVTEIDFEHMNEIADQDKKAPILKLFAEIHLNKEKLGRTAEAGKKDMVESFEKFNKKMKAIIRKLDGGEDRTPDTTFCSRYHSHEKLKSGEGYDCGIAEREKKCEELIKKGTELIIDALAKIHKARGSKKLKTQVSEADMEELDQAIRKAEKLANKVESPQKTQVLEDIVKAYQEAVQVLDMINALVG